MTNRCCYRDSIMKTKQIILMTISSSILADNTTDDMVVWSGPRPPRPAMPNRPVPPCSRIVGCRHKHDKWARTRKIAVQSGRLVCGNQGGDTVGFGSCRLSGIPINGDFLRVHQDWLSATQALPYGHAGSFSCRHPAVRFF